MELVRSPLLMNQDDTALMIIDIQEKLLPHIREHQRLIWNSKRLIEGATALGVEIMVSEQYPKGLGGTHEEIIQALGPDFGQRSEKTMFSCRECSTLIENLSNKQIRNVLLAGIEAHVCVMQTAMDLLAAGFDVYVCNDAVGSRFENDFDTAMARMQACGVTLVTTEMALFEWCERAGSDQFKAISAIVRDKFSS